MAVRIEQEVADSFADGRPAGFTGENDLESRFDCAVPKAFRLGCLSGPVWSLERHEPAALPRVVRRHPPSVAEELG